MRKGHNCPKKARLIDTLAQAHGRVMALHNRDTPSRADEIAEQARAVFTTAILTAVVDKGPTVISLPGDIASANAPDDSAHEIAIPAAPVFRPADADIDKLAGMIEAAKKVAIFGGDGCRDARDEVLQLAARLKAPVGYSLPRQAMAGTW
jgi:thiamine pyrophosphate-dependent acetolactate synthase large subunit-like protein